MNAQKFLLCGFMGSGKSTLLKKIQLNAPKNMKFYDLDKSLLKATNHSDISKCMADLGESKFRLLEQKILLGLYHATTDVAIALGGGALEQLPSLLKESSVLIWLDTPFHRCLKRIRSETLENRPLAKKLSEQKLEELYQRRLPNYRDCHFRLTPQKAMSIRNFSQFLSCII